LIHNLPTMHRLLWIFLFACSYVQAAPQLNLDPNQFVPAFGQAAAAAARSMEDHVFVHVDYVGPDGEPAVAVSPYITDGVINAAETSARLSAAGTEAAANWVKNNPGAAAGMAVATLMVAALPAAPVAAWVLGSTEAAAASTATEVVIGGMIYSGTKASVTTMVNEFGSDHSAGQQLMNVLGSGGAAALISIPGSLVGANVTRLFGTFVADQTAGALGWAAGKGIDATVNAMGISSAAQLALTGDLQADAPRRVAGGTALVAAPSDQPQFLPQPGSR